MARQVRRTRKEEPKPVKRSLILPVIIGVGLLAVAVGLRFGAVALFERYPIAKVKVVGELIYVDRNELQAALSPYVTESFFTLPLQKVKQTAESLTWIDSADAKKEWPDTLIVTLQERVPVANWGNNQFLSAKGEIFFAEHVQHNATLPTFKGSTEQVAIIAQHFSEMQKVLNEVGLSVMTLELEDRVSWKAQLDDGLKLIIDDKDSLKKLKRFTVLYQQLSDQQKKQLFKVDLRYENGLAIEWKNDDDDTNAA